MPFEEAVRIGFEKIAVLEGAGLALVAVDRHQPRRRLLAHQPPFAPGRKPGAAEPAQPGMFERLDHLVAGALARQAGLQQAIAAVGAVGVEADIDSGDRRMCVSPAATAAATVSTVACSCSAWPIATTGALSQPPMHGARTTRTRPPSRLCRLAQQLRARRRVRS